MMTLAIVLGAIAVACLSASLSACIVGARKPMPTPPPAPRRWITFACGCPECHRAEAHIHVADRLEAVR